MVANTNNWGACPRVESSLEYKLSRPNSHTCMRKGLTATLAIDLMPTHYDADQSKHPQGQSTRQRRVTAPFTACKNDNIGRLSLCIKSVRQHQVQLVKTCAQTKSSDQLGSPQSRTTMSNHLRATKKVAIPQEADALASAWAARCEPAVDPGHCMSTTQAQE